jgi:hypothetical protein
MAGEKYVTSSKLIPIINSLKLTIEKINPNKTVAIEPLNMFSKPCTQEIKDLCFYLKNYSCVHFFQFEIGHGQRRP